MRRPLLLLSLAASAVLLSCAAVAPDPLVVWSNVTDVAYAVERYNLEDDRPVHFRFVPDLAQALTQERSDADVVIGRWINTPIVNRLIMPPSDYLPRQKGRLDPPFLTALAFGDGSSPWLPLSYNIPTLVFAVRQIHVDQPFALSFATLSESVRWTNREKGSEPPVFAPYADNTGLYAVYRSLGFAVTVDTGGSPVWSSSVLSDAVESVRTWQLQEFGSAEDEGRYIARYLYDPPFRQIDNGRVGFFYGSSQSVFNWSFLGDRSYDFRWLARDDRRLVVNENVVYGGILSDTTQKDRAVQFLSWLTTPAVQVDLTAGKIAAGIDTFGFLEGFSTIPDVNTELSQEVYPRLRGRVPSPGILVVPGMLPRYWNEAVDQVVAPFLASPGRAEDLSSRLDRWYRQRGD